MSPNVFKMYPSLALVFFKILQTASRDSFLLLCNKLSFEKSTKPCFFLYKSRIKRCEENSNRFEKSRHTPAESNEKSWVHGGRYMRERKEENSMPQRGAAGFSRQRKNPLSSLTYGEALKIGRWCTAHTTTWSSTLQSRLNAW